MARKAPPLLLRGMRASPAAQNRKNFEKERRKAVRVNNVQKAVENPRSKALMKLCLVLLKEARFILLVSFIITMIVIIIWHIGFMMGFFFDPALLDLKLSIFFCCGIKDEESVIGAVVCEIFPLPPVRHIAEELLLQKSLVLQQVV